MKKVVYILTASILFFACKKTDLANPESQSSLQVQSLLKDSLSAIDYETVNFSSARKSSLSNEGSITRIGFLGKDILHDFIVVKEDGSGHITQSRIVHLEGSITPATAGRKPSFNGKVDISSLRREIHALSVVTNGYIMSLHTAKVHSNAVGVNYAECSDCTLPEVIVSASYNSSGGISWGAWMSLLAMFDGGGNSNQYISIEYGGGGGGGGGSVSTGDVIAIDYEAPENKDKIDAKKYIDCFGTIPDNNATCIITIASDIPVDGHPEKFFNWSEASPGHTYIELYKAGSSGGIISQNIGFYPNTVWKTVGGGDIGSKLADDAGHEYNARYSISVTPAQLQAALNMVQTLSTHDYNISSYNCTDFALAVFNAGGGNLTIPKYQIPGYENGTTGSNTPQGLYNQLNDMGGAGNAAVNIVGSKGYGGTSHGPCN